MFEIEPGFYFLQQPDFAGFAACAMMPNRMNGQLIERPLAEVIREISAKSLSGRLHLEQDPDFKGFSWNNGGGISQEGSLDERLALKDLRVRDYGQQAKKNATKHPFAYHTDRRRAN